MRELLAGGGDIVISDPRRMGKTCLLDRFVFMTGPPWMAIKIDYEGVQTADEFLHRTIDGLRGHDRMRAQVIEAVKSFMDNVEVGAGPLKVKTVFQHKSASELLDITVSRIDETLKGDQRLVLALDEVPLAIENIARNKTDSKEGPLSADTLLQTLRRLRQRTKRIRWIITGSVGFHHVLRLAGSTEGAINDLSNIACGPLDLLWARELATMLLRGIGADFDEQTVTELVEISDGIPFFLHNLVLLLRDSYGPCTAASVQTAWASFLADRDQSRAATHLLTRLLDYYGESTAAAEKILDIVAMAAEPMPAATLIETVGGGLQLLDGLVDDHYLIDTPRGVGWRYQSLRQIWITRRRLS
jgi:hypothetical protein